MANPPRTHTTDDLLARADNWIECRPFSATDSDIEMVTELAAALRSLRDELHYLAEYTTNIHEAEAERRALSPSTGHDFDPSGHDFEPPDPMMCDRCGCHLLDHDGER